MLVDLHTNQLSDGQRLADSQGLFAGEIVEWMWETSVLLRDPQYVRGDFVKRDLSSRFRVECGKPIH